MTDLQEKLMIGTSAVLFLGIATYGFFAELIFVPCRDDLCEYRRKLSFLVGLCTVTVLAFILAGKMLRRRLK